MFWIAAYAFSIGTAIFATQRAHASRPVSSSDDVPVSGQCGDEGIRIATGASDKGYAQMFNDLQKVCGQEVQLCQVRSTGGLDNLNLLTNKKADVGMAQIDTIKEMSNGNDNISALQAIMPLNFNYLHVLTKTGGYQVPAAKKWGFLPSDPDHITITKFSDLKNRKVVLVGSTQQLATTWAKGPLKDYNLSFEYVKTDQEAVTMVQSGAAQAMFSVSGAPFPFVDSLTMKHRLSLVPFDEDFGAMYSVRKITYSNIGANNMRALAIPNVLLTRPFGAKKAAVIQKLKQCIIDKLETLKDGDYQPGWNEVRPENAVDVTKFVAPASAAARKK